MPRSRSQVGKLSRRKGAAFELVLRDELIRAFKGSGMVFEARRSSQAERAHDSDVVIEGGVPPLLKRIWWECQHAANPTPDAKLDQAVRDVTAYYERTGVTRWPVIVWRKHGTRTVYATTTLALMVGHMISDDHAHAAGGKPGGDILVTVELDQFLRVLRARCDDR